MVDGGELPKLRSYSIDRNSKDIKITIPFTKEALKSLIHSGNFFCIAGPHSNLFKEYKFTVGALMYAMKENEQNDIRKYGQTSNINNCGYTEQQLLQIRITTILRGWNARLMPNYILLLKSGLEQCPYEKQ